MLRLKNRLWRYAPVALMATIGVGLTWAVTGVVQQLEQQRLQAEHDQKVAQITNLIQAEVKHNLDASVMLANFIDASDAIDPAQLQKFGDHLLAEHRGLLSLAWVKAVPQADRAAYEAEFGPIRDRLENSQFIPSPTRSVYFPENQLIPLNDPVGQQGWELGGDVVRRRALQTAYKANAIQVTELIPLPHGSNGIVTFVPVPPPGATEDLQSIRGFVRSVFPLREFVQNVVAQVRHQPGQDLYLLSDATAQYAFWVKIDGATGVAAVHVGELPELKTGIETLCPRPTNCFQPIAVGQLQWRLLVSQGAIKPSQAFESQLWLFRLLGFGSTIALVAYLLINLRQTRQIAALAAQKTAQTEQLTTTLNELQSTQAQLVQSAKMSSLGQLVAGIAHEVNNPVNFIHGNLRHVERYSQDLLTIVETCEQTHPQPEVVAALAEEYELAFVRSDLPKLLASMQAGTQRIREIVLSLRNFSRLDEAEFKVVNLHDGIESTLMILQHRMQQANTTCPIAVVKQYGELPLIQCCPGLLNQVLMNLIANAIDAVMANPVDRPPQITLTTAIVADQVQIGIQDNGVGISEADQKSLFNPFFTTKPVGEGTGLGLSISYKIITEQHGGKIWLESSLGRGTTFWITLPQSVD
jgi:two-component system, NtrC family, sensor kinase